jgi:hypothetical protein
MSPYRDVWLHREPHMAGTRFLRNRIPRLAVVGAAVLIAVVPAWAARATPTAVTLHLDGSHPLDNFHVGTFTSTPPLCPTGTWQGHGNGTRTFTCADGTGTFLARFSGAVEHVPGATGPWSITNGTGTYLTLRGRGNGHVDSSNGTDDDTTGPRPTFSDTWTGDVDFDATAPTGAFTSVKTIRPRTAAGTWSVTVAFSTRDNVTGNPVAFLVTAKAGQVLLNRSGTVRTGSASFTLRFRPAKLTRVLRVEIQLSDQWGNQATVTRNARLR